MPYNTINVTAIRNAAGTIVDHLMFNRPVNRVCDAIVDINGNITQNAYELFPGVTLMLCRELVYAVSESSLRVHHTVLVGGQFLESIIKRNDLDAACASTFESDMGVEVRLSRDVDVGWIFISFKQLDEVIEKVREFAQL